MLTVEPPHLKLTQYVFCQCFVYAK